MAELQTLGPTTPAVFADRNQASMRQRFVHGVSWNLIGTALAQGSVFAANVVVANLLGPQSFGEFSLLQNSALTLSAIAQVATGVTATRYIAEYRQSDPARAGRIIGFCSLFTSGTGLLAGLILFLLAGWLSIFTLNAPQLSDGLKIMALYLVFSAMSGYQTGALAGLEGYRHVARLGVIHSGIHMVCCVTGVWFFGLLGALWGLVASLAVRWWLYHVAIRVEARLQGIQPTYSIEKAERDLLWRFSLPAALSGLTSMPALWLANTFVVQQPGGYVQLGLFSAAFSLRTAVILIPTALNAVGGAIISNQIRAANGSHFRQAFWSNVMMLAASSVVGVGLMIFIGPSLVAWLGKDFQEAVKPLRLLMLSVLAEAIAIGLYQVIQTQERMWWSLIAVSIPRDGLIVIVAYMLASSQGATGLAVAYLAGWTFAACVIAVNVYRIGVTPSIVSGVSMSHNS